MSCVVSIFVMSLLVLQSTVALTKSLYRSLSISLSHSVTAGWHARRAQRSSLLSLYFSLSLSCPLSPLPYYTHTSSLSHFYFCFAVTMSLIPSPSLIFILFPYFCPLIRDNPAPCSGLWTLSLSLSVSHTHRDSLSLSLSLSLRIDPGMVVDPVKLWQH